MNYGATPDEWLHFDLVEGLTSDLLPVVCRPDQKIYEHSHLRVYGKVPSRYTVQGEVVGFTNWTSFNATDRDILSWSATPDYGICLQTRRVRALDFDILDQSYATYLQDSLSLLGYDFPYRTRSNSSKFLTLFSLEGDYGKQTLTTPHGIIEFLATGQQCVVAGTHPSGVRYQWDWRHPIPTLRPDECEELLQSLASMVTGIGESVIWSAPARIRVVDRTLATGAAVEDSVLRFLVRRGLVLRMAPDGRTFLRCPWADGHSTASDCTETCWFPGGTNGFEQGHFKCLHASCFGRTDDEFLRAIGYDEDGFDVIGPPVERAVVTPGDAVYRGHTSPDVLHHPVQSLVHRLGDRPCDAVRERHERPLLADVPGGSGAADTQYKAQTRSEGPLHAEVLSALGAGEAPKTLVVTEGTAHPLDLPLFERHSESGKIKPKLTNIILAFQRPDLIGAVIGWDEFKAEMVYRPWPLTQPYLQRPDTWTTGAARPFKDSDYVSLHLALAKMNFGPAGIPTDLIRQSVVWIAEQRSYDSAISWLHTLPEWDGVPRVETFCSRYAGADDSPYARAVGRYWWTAHIARILVPGCQADMAVILYAVQGTRKTTIIRNIVPHEEQYAELDLNERDDDLSRKMRGKLIGELAEMKSLNSKDNDAIKAWVSRRREEWVPKYQEFSRSFPRRLVLVGTTNNEEFLADETGNRRWLPMECEQQDADAVVRDREQLWAEAYQMYLSFGLLYGEAERLAKAQHEQYMITDVWDTSVIQWLDADDGFAGKPADREHLFMTDVLQGAVGLTNHQINMSVQFRMGRVLRKLGYVKINKLIGNFQQKVWVKRELYLGVQG